ncbi:hypothetical protein AAFN86_23910 [Roseomonas sp. CAU 1739]
MLPLSGCTLPASNPSPPRPVVTAPPPVVLASLAAIATVRFFDATTRQAVLETAGGAVIDMTAAPEARRFGTLRQGARVVVEYEASGVVRIAPAARLARADAGGRIRATIREVAIGGGTMVLAGPDGGTQEVTLQNPPMMAFATRLRAGDEVAVTLVQDSAP